MGLNIKKSNGNSQGAFKVLGTGGRVRVYELIPYVTDGLQVNLDAGNPASYPGSGTTWTDTKSGLQFTLHSGVSYHSDNGGVLRFDGTSNGWADTATSLGSFSMWSVEAWIKMNSSPPNPGNTDIVPCVFSETYDGGPINFSLTVPSGNPRSKFNYGGGWWDGGSWHQITANDGPVVTNGEWHHVVLTYDGSTNKIYYDGDFYTDNGTDVGTPTSSGIGYRIARRWDLVTAEMVPADIPIVRMYGKALSSGEVAQNFGALRGRYGV